MFHLLVVSPATTVATLRRDLPPSIEIVASETVADAVQLLARQARLDAALVATANAASDARRLQRAVSAGLRLGAVAVAPDATPGIVFDSDLLGLARRLCDL